MEADPPFGDKHQPFVASPPPAQRAPLAAGQVIDQYRLDGHLHQGVTAQLWRASAVDGLDATPLVMKLPRARSGEAAPNLVGLEVEQQLLPTLSGVHVPRFVAKGEHGGQPYLVMERITGPSLKPRLEAAPLPVKEVVELGVRIANALHDLHRQHLIHLDLRAANLMFRPVVDGAGGEVVFIDFSQARHDQMPDLLAAEDGIPAGAAPYVAAEQVKAVRADPRSDLFSLGVLLYQLLTGEHPFGPPEAAPPQHERLNREPAPPRALRADCPPWLQEVLLRCLDLSPHKRHPTAAQLAFDLQNPEQVALTERSAGRQRGHGGVGVMKRLLSAWSADPNEAIDAARQVARSPMVLVAVDIAGAEPALLDSLRGTAQRLLQAESGARLACVVVVKSVRTAMDPADKDITPQIHLMIQLKHWARPLLQALKLPIDAASGRVSFHVLQAPDVATALASYARKNQVDHIVMGARSSGLLRRFLGGVASQVAAQADCSVTVVRHLPPRR